MTLTTRRLLYIFFIFVFITVTPIIILYASGYKIKSGLQIQKTGALIIDTKPRGAKIFLNNKPYENFLDNFFKKDKAYLTSPARIKNLLPGEYDLRLEMDGYWPWQKKLTVLPGQSTYVEDVTLFRNNLPILTVPFGGNSLQYSPNGEYILLTGTSTPLVYYINEDKVAQLSTSTAKISLADKDQIWSPDSKKLFWGKNIFNIDNALSETDISSAIGESVSDISWSDDSNTLYYLSKGDLYRFNLSNNSTDKLITGQNIQDYLLKGNQILFVPNPGKSSVLKTWDLSDKKITRQINLPSSVYEFVNPKNSYVNLYDKQSKILYLIDMGNSLKPLKEILSNVNSAHWVDNNKMIYYNDFEVWLYENDSATKKILTRISEPIKDIFWHPSNNYIIFVTDTNIDILELDNREKHNITKLIGLDGIDSPILDKAGDRLYFISEIGKQKGMYSLQIE